MNTYERDTTSRDSQMEENPIQKEDVVAEITPTKIDEKIIDQRFEQSYASRLSEYITGLKTDDPEIIDRLIADKEIIRVKYNLPAQRLSTDYEKELQDIAKKIGVKIRETSDCGSFFKDNPFANGAYLTEANQVGVDIDKTSRIKYGESLNVLEHELIHALQKKLSRSMPIELMEYEAYIAGGNVKSLKENPKAVELVFSYLIGGSVNNWYHQKSKERKAEILPKWNDPKYFLEEIDKMSGPELEKYLRIKKLKEDLEK
ncbi:MAG: hypothetical protein WCF92_01695 [bacterium]